MSSRLILPVRIYQKLVQTYFHQGSSAFFTLKASLGKSWQLPVSARSVSTRNNPGSRQTDGGNRGQGGVKNTTGRFRENESWDDAVSGRGKISNLRQKPSFPKSVFASGTAKRTAEMMRRKAALFHEQEPELRPTRRTEKMQPPDQPLSVAGWRELKESHGNSQHFAFQMMIALFSSGAELDVAKSLLTFVVTETGTLSYKLLLRYLTLCVHGGHDVEVFDVYDIMRGNYPSLDTGASSLFIKSFSRTARWREAIGILREVEKVLLPSSSNYGDVISGAMLHGDTTTAWALYNELIEKGLSPNEEIWDTLFRGASKIEEEKRKEAESVSQPEHEAKLLGILLYMRDNQLYPKHNLASHIKTWFESLTEQKWTGRWTNANQNGVCGSCGSEFESIQLTAEEYQQLKDKVMADIIQGKDVFKKTNPEELERFKAFVKKRPPFDVVVDGLNVANSSSEKSIKSEMLLAVVSELERRGLTILVLGRKHMLRPTRSWNRHNMALIQKKAHCFFTENISEDDPFLLYATLHSGNHCQFVSRDLMRDHKACLSDGATRQLFFKWQRGHQLVVNGSVTAGRGVQFLSIPRYDTIVQRSADSWHLPYDDTDDRSTYEVPLQWLCLTKKH